MSQTVVIANQNVQEGRAIAQVLAARYDACPVTESAALMERVEKATAVVLDTNFSDAQGIDVLMEVMARAQVPVLMITPDDQPACAVEAIRCGAAGFLVKTAAYAELLPTAVQDAVQRIRSNEEIKRQLTELRKRNAELEKELKSARAQTNPGMTDSLSVSAAPLASIQEIVAGRINSGTLQLPSYPRIATKLRELLQKDVGIAEVAQLLSQDAAISAKLLRMANAAQFGNLRQVDTVEGAVSRLGLSGACGVAEVIANRSLYASRNVRYREMLEDLRLHSVACGHACIAIGQQAGKSSWRKMFSLGLLHDCGRLALMQAVAQGDPEGKCIEGEENLNTFRAFLRKHNVNSGVALMQRWGFDQEYIDAVRYNFDLSGVEMPTRTLMVVNLANTMVRAIGYGSPLDSPDELEQSPAKGFLFPGDSDLAPMIEEVHRAMEQTKRMLA